MTKPVVKPIKVLDAQYVADVDSIIILGETKLDNGDMGRLQQQIHSSCFAFGNLDKVTEMKKTAELMKGKTINMAFDTDLINKIDKGEALNYE